MTTPYWHIHHGSLLEWTEDINERIAYIRENKPEHEVGTRLRWMTPVQGELPAVIVEARRAYDATWRACDEVGRKHRKDLEALHTTEHPGCPWNGIELVFESEGKS